MKLDPEKSTLRRFTISVVSRCLALLVALSFLSTLVFIGSASAKQSTPACCVGKTADHCHSSVKSKKAAGHDHSSNPSSPAVKAIEQQCHSDCCACVASSRQQKRDGASVQAVARHGSLFATCSLAENAVAFFLSNQSWAQISPRGPPTFILQHPA